MFNMKFAALLMGLLSLGACNDDAASRDKGAAGTVTTPGATGTITLFSQPSQIFRSAGTQGLTTSEASAKILANTLENFYRTIPDMAQDDEKYTTVMTRPVVSCGLGSTFSGTESRIRDCAVQNNNSATWLSVNYGEAGEGTWKLVAYNQNTNKEIWKDMNTGLLWSDIIVSANWCKASGNIQGVQGDITVNCQELSENTSFCANYSLSDGPTVKWRLPTRNDFLQADLNGARFILKAGDNAIEFWTATVNSRSLGRSEAWAYSYGQGLISSQSLTASKQIRCVGVAAN